MGAQQHEQYGRHIQPARHAQDEEEQDREQGGGRQRGRDLHHRLEPGRQARVAADGDAHRDGPSQGNNERRNDPQQGDERAQGDIAPFFQGESPEHFGTPERVP